LSTDPAPIASPMKSRIPAPLVKPSPAPLTLASPAKILAKPRSPLKERLRRGAAKPGAGARGKNQVLGKDSVDKKEIARKITLVRQLSPKKPVFSLSPKKPAIAGPSAQADKKPRDAVHALSRLDKALARLSLPKPSRPPSALGFHSAEAVPAAPNAAPMQRFSSSPAVLGTGPNTGEGTRSPQGAVGLLGLPTRRPGLAHAPPGGLAVVPGSPVKHAGSSSHGETLSQPPAQAEANPFLIEHPGDEIQTIEHTQGIAKSDSNSKGPSLDDVLLHINGIQPLPVAGIFRSEAAPAAKDTSSARVFEASRALTETIAQNGQTKPRVVSERVVRPVRATRTASMTIEQSKPRANAKMAGSLNILKGCVIFVDVTLENGEDAGSLFVEMLKGLGARVRWSLAYAAEC
jgi:hypothetical protein